MTEPPMEEPVEDWLDQHQPVDPEDESPSPPELDATVEADEADVLEQHEPIEEAAEEDYPHSS
jgi:hypothetical protein